ncbi:MAG: DUF2281 domain-containing protein [Methanoregulaceae archaeon]|nr:MAG: DUF2281 domain-containing protein [Methanoregulaceae archaeon]
MSSSDGSVEEKIRMLPPDLRQEAIHYELAKRKKKPQKKKFRRGWAGGLSHIDKSVTSVELQHEASKWRG